ncbi:MAG: hypothetical protein ACTSYM_08395 [Candidatus Baldrarchaeia archaeon]
MGHALSIDSFYYSVVIKLAEKLGSLPERIPTNNKVNPSHIRIFE